MVLKINGLDIIPYIAYGGVAWQRSDIDGPNAGRGQDGLLIRDRIATKIRFDITCRPLTSSELAVVLSSIQPEWIQLQYTDPITNSIKTGTFYSNNIPAQFLMKHRNGMEYWGGVTFPLIQK